MIKTESREIGTRGYTYTVIQFGAREGSRTLIRLAKMLGKPVGDAVSAGESLDLRAAGAMISGLATAITEGEFEQLCVAFGARSTVTGGNTDQATQLQYNGKQVPLKDLNIFDLHFAGEYVELMGWLAFALEVNYGSFLAVANAAKSDLLVGLHRGSTAVDAGSESQSQSPPT